MLEGLEQAQSLLGLVPREEDAAERSRRLRVARVLGERRAQRVLVARLDGRRGGELGLRGHQGVEEALDLGGRDRAGELGGHVPVAERLDRRDPLHPEGLGDRGVPVDVELGQVDLALAGGGSALERRRELAARAAPLGPEVDDHGHLARALEHLLLEGLLGYVEHGHTFRIGRPLLRGRPVGSV